MANMCTCRQLTISQIVLLCMGYNAWKIATKVPACISNSITLALMCKIILSPVYKYWQGYTFYYIFGIADDIQIVGYNPDGKEA